MPTAFAHTAPRFTIDEVHQEKENLKLDEKFSIKDEVCGSRSLTTMEETDQLLSEALIQFQNELDGIPSENKSAYLEAHARVPDLVSKESNPISFLRRDKFNAKVRSFEIDCQLVHTCIHLIMMVSIFQSHDTTICR